MSSVYSIKNVFCVTPKRARKVNMVLYNTQADGRKYKCYSEKQKCQHISKDIKWQKIKCYQLLSLKKGFSKSRDKIKDFKKNKNHILKA